MGPQFEQTVRQYLDYLAACRRSPRTTVGYATTFRYFAATFPGLRTEEISEDHLTHFLANLDSVRVVASRDNSSRRDRPITGLTAHGHARNMRAFLRWAHKRGYCGAIDIPMPSYEYPEMKTLPDWAMRDLLAYAAQRATHSLGDMRNYVLVSLLAFTAMRRGEILALSVDDLLFGTDPSLRIRSGKGRRERTVPMHSALVGILRDYARNLRAAGVPDLMWSQQTDRPVNPRWAYSIVHRLARDAGLENVPTNPHAFRHTAITQMVENHESLAAVQRVAGHGSIQTTLRYYVHASNASRISAVNSLSYGGSALVAVAS